jgi:hypothetical protein
MTLDLALNVLRAALTVVALVLAAGLSRAPRLRPARIAAAIRRPCP